MEEGVGGRGGGWKGGWVEGRVWIMFLDTVYGQTVSLKVNFT